MKKSRGHRPRWIMVTGLSGSGKTTALKVLEDEGFFSIDNLPLALLPQLLAMLKKSPNNFPKVALGMDARERYFLKSYSEVVNSLREAGIKPEILFFESHPESLIRRYSESRRPHPLRRRGSLVRAIAEEQRRLAPLREVATKVFDTTESNIHSLKLVLRHYLNRSVKPAKFAVQLLSFGYKNGLPTEADLVFDVRCFQNPYFVPALKGLDGRSRPVQKFVLEQRATKVFLSHTLRLLKFLLPLYQKEGKARLTVAVGCTGGRHRSVSVVEALDKKLKDRRWELHKSHRDIAQG